MHISGAYVGVWERALPANRAGYGFDGGQGRHPHVSLTRFLDELSSVDTPYLFVDDLFDPLQCGVSAVVTVEGLSHRLESVL